MRNDKEYYNYIINYTKDNKAISYKDLKKEITKENKKACRNHLKLIRTELRHERIYDLEIPSIMGISTAISSIALYTGITNNNSDALFVGSSFAIVALANVGLALLDSESKERKAKIKKLSKEKKKIKNYYETETEIRLAQERKFIDSKKPYVKTK